MGCGESKDVKQISSADATKKLKESVKELDVVRISTGASDLPDGALKRHTPNTPHEGSVPTTKKRVDSGNYAYLATIPVSDLGESLDVGPRRLRHPLVGIQPAQTHQETSASSAHSSSSCDSGVYDLDSDYSFVITENSSPEVVRRVVDAFSPVDGLDLTIQGVACPRRLSGYQKAKADEQMILQSLREEGLIQTARQTCQGGVSFTIVEEGPKADSPANHYKPKDFLPPSHFAYLESQRLRHQQGLKTSADIERKQYMADERRKAELESRRERLATARTREKPREVSIAEQRDLKLGNAMDNREAHLRDLRDRLKAKNQRVKEIKLKKLVNAPPVPVPVGGGHLGHRSYDPFFD